MKKIIFIVVTFVAALGGFLFGFDTAVVSGALLFIVKQFSMSPTAEGWFVSSALIGSILGVAVAGVLSDKFGRQKILLISALMFLTTAIGCMVADTQSTLIIYRFIGGVGIGVASILSPMYLSEISPAKIRGRIVSLYQMAITIGILGIYMTNAYFFKLSGNAGFTPQNPFLQHVLKDEVWRSMFGVGIVPAILFFCLLFIIPESPRWLYIRGFRDKALAVLRKVREPEEINDDLEALQKEKYSPKSKTSLKGFARPLWIGIVFALLIQFSGITVVIYYGAKILNMAHLGLNGSFNGQLLIGLVNVVFTLLAIFTIDKFGRRPLLIFGALLSFVCHMFIGILFYTGHSDSNWLVFFLLLYTAAFAASYGPVFWTVISEIYPNHIRGKAMSIAAMVQWCATALVSQLVPLMLVLLSPAGTFWVFAILSLPAVYLGWKVLPETKGKSLEEIEELWIIK